MKIKYQMACMYLRSPKEQKPCVAIWRAEVLVNLQIVKDFMGKYIMMSFTELAVGLNKDYKVSLKRG